MKNLFLFIQKRMYVYALSFLSALAIFLTGKIVYDFQRLYRDKHASILLLTKALETSRSQGVIPDLSFLPMLERAYHLGGPSAKPFAGFLATCFYLHREPSKGAYYATVAYDQGAKLHPPTPIQKLLKEMTDAYSIEEYARALDISYQLLHHVSSSEDYPLLHFLTQLRIIDLKEKLNQNTQEDFHTLARFPIFKEFEQFYKEGDWTLTKRFDKNAHESSQRS